MTQINYTVTIEGHDIDVTFSGKPHSCDDGIGSYEYQGFKGYDSRPYVSCEDTITFDSSKLSRFYIHLINLWLEND